MSLGIRALVEDAKRPPKSDFETWLDNLDADDREAIEVARFDSTISREKLYRILKSVGAPIGKDALGVWRNG